MDVNNELMVISKNVEILYEYITELENNMKNFEKITYKCYKDYMITYNFNTNEVKNISYDFINYSNVIVIGHDVIWFNDNKLFKLDNNKPLLIKEFSGNILKLHQYHDGYRVLTTDGEIWDNDTLVCNIGSDVTNTRFNSIFVIITINNNENYYEIVDNELVKSNKNNELIDSNRYSFI